ncbi:MAG: DUF2769 domain-containing protein [Candidatus Pacebacteria bacterium]|nr:DUF2769 domain-containing protein [Candidatus Paceibacterota bacterium]
MAVIDFTKENMERCRCSQCPVQGTSKCVKEKLNNIKNLREDEMPTSEDFPGMYCANGYAYCEDLDPEKECQCATCGNWKMYNLGNADPSQKYCQNGEAEETEEYKETEGE